MAHLSHWRQFCVSLINEDIPGYDYSRFLLYFFCPKKGPSEGRLCRVRECIRRLNPGGKGRRCRFRRGGTNTTSKTVKGSHFDHRSRVKQVLPNRIHFGTPKSKPLEKQKNKKETTVHFSEAIDRTSVSSGIVRTLRDGWRTINCVVFVTDERSVPQCVLEKAGQTWLPFEFVVFLCCTHILICIRGVLHL